MSNLVLCIDEDDFARMEAGAAISIADPLKTMRVQVCAPGHGYCSVDVEQIAIGTDVRSGMKCQFLTIKMQNEMSST